MHLRNALYCLLFLGLSLPGLAQTNISADTSAARRARLPVGYREPVATPGGLYLLDRTKATPAPISFDQVNSLRPRMLQKTNAVETNNLYSTGKNKFDPAAKGIAQDVYRTHMDVVVSNTGFVESDYTPLLPVTTYVVSAAGTLMKQYVTFYDSLLVHIPSTVGDQARATTSFTTPARTAYARFTVPRSVFSTFQVEQGSTLTSYEPFTRTLMGITDQGTAALGVATSASATAGTALTLAAAAKTTGSNALTLAQKTDAQFTHGVQYYDASAAGQLSNFYWCNTCTGPTAYAGFTTSNLIATSPGDTLWFTQKQYVAFFKTDSTLNSSSAGSYLRATNYLVVPALSAFFRASMPTADTGIFMIAKGQGPFAWQRYKQYVKAETATGDDALSKVISTSMTLSGMVQTGKNLFDKNHNTADGLGRNIYNAYITNTGTKVTGQPNYVISHFMPVIGGQTYTPGSNDFVVFYAADTTTVVGGFSYGRPTAPYSVTAPAGSVYMRVTVPISLLNTFQVQRGTSIVNSGNYGPDLLSGVRTPTSLTGKTVWLCGTSIPAQGGHHEQAASLSGYTLINQAIGGSEIRNRDRTGSITNQSFLGSFYGLSQSYAEKSFFIANYSTGLNYHDSLSAAFYRPATMSSSDSLFIMRTSWEYRLKPYLDGTYPMPDLFVFDHGYNDRNASNETVAQWLGVDLMSRNRNTFTGATNFLIDKIKAANPRARIAFVSHYEPNLRPELIVLQQNLADLWNAPIVRLDRKMELSQQLITTTGVTVYATSLSDRLHLESDPTRLTAAGAGRILAAELPANF